MDSTQLKNEEKALLFIGNGVSKAVKLLDEGFNLTKVPIETSDIRFLICKGCPRLFKTTDEETNKELNQCLECGCDMEFKTQLKYDPFKFGFAKTLIVCPLGKW